jgi:hypothetical protein
MSKNSISSDLISLDQIHHRLRRMRDEFTFYVSTKAGKRDARLQ